MKKIVKTQNLDWFRQTAEHQAGNKGAHPWWKSAGQGNTGETKCGVGNTSTGSPDKQRMAARLYNDNPGGGGNGTSTVRSDVGAAQGCERGRVVRERPWWRGEARVWLADAMAWARRLESQARWLGFGRMRRRCTDGSRDVGGSIRERKNSYGPARQKGVSIEEVAKTGRCSAGPTCQIGF